MPKTRGSSKASSSSTSKGKGKATDKGKEKAPARMGAPNPDFQNRLNSQTGRELWLERGLDLEELAGTFVSTVIATHSWEGFARYRNRANEEIVREFYAAMYPPHFLSEGVVTVRGVQVKITSAAINEHYATPTRPELPRGYPYHELFTQYNGQLAAALRMNGSTIWNAQEHHRLRQSQLHADAAFWRIFSDYSLRPTSHRTFIPLETACLLYCVRNGLPLDIGTIVMAEIAYIGRQTSGVLGFPCLITYFCEQHGIDVYNDADNLLSPMGNLGRSTYNKVAVERQLPKLPGPPPKRRQRVEDEPEDDVEGRENTPPRPRGPATIGDLMRVVVGLSDKIDMKFDDFTERFDLMEQRVDNLAERHEEVAREVRETRGTIQEVGGTVRELQGALVNLRLVQTYQTNASRPSSSSQQQPPPPSQ